MAGKCIFCGVTAVLTREHIRADWLSGYLPREKVNYEAGQVTVNLPGLPQGTKSRIVGGDHLSRRVRCVCKDCNTGWMKQLQDLAKPIVVPLLTGEAVTLNKQQRRILAAWIAMAVMCSEFGKDQLQAIAPKDRETLYRHKVPPKINWRIWIGRYQRDKCPNQWDHRALIILPAEKIADRVTTDGRSYNTQSTTYAVGELFIHVISSDYTKCISRFRVIDNDHLVQLWPCNDSAVITWPPSKTLTDDHSAVIAAGFFDGLRRAGTNRSARPKVRKS